MYDGNPIDQAFGRLRSYEAEVSADAWERLIPALPTRKRRWVWLLVPLFSLLPLAIGPDYFHSAQTGNKISTPASENAASHSTEWKAARMVASIPVATPEREQPQPTRLAATSPIKPELPASPVATNYTTPAITQHLSLFAQAISGDSGNVGGNTIEEPAISAHAIDQPHHPQPGTQFIDWIPYRAYSDPVVRMLPGMAISGKKEKTILPGTNKPAYRPALLFSVTPQVAFGRFTPNTSDQVLIREFEAKPFPSNLGGQLALVSEWPVWRNLTFQVGLQGQWTRQSFNLLQQEASGIVTTTGNNLIENIQIKPELSAPVRVNYGYVSRSLDAVMGLGMSYRKHALQAAWVIPVAQYATFKSGNEQQAAISRNHLQSVQVKYLYRIPVAQAYSLELGPQLQTVLRPLTFEGAPLGISPYTLGLSASFRFR